MHFCPITAFLPFLFLPSEGVKSALEATFSALLITFSAAPRWKTPPSSLPAFVAPKDKISRWIVLLEPLREAEEDGGI